MNCAPAYGAGAATAVIFLKNQVLGVPGGDAAMPAHCAPQTKKRCPKNFSGIAKQS